MFTGIIETTGRVNHIISNSSNKELWISSPVSTELKPDQSVSHNGVCLTIEEILDGQHRVTAVSETLEKTNLHDWKEGSIINIERCLLLSDRLDGHLVQGHIDCTATCKKIKEKQGSWEIEFEFPVKFAELIVEKGSIAIDGISLTAFNVKRKSFRVAIVPYTYRHTSIQTLEAGHRVNIEFDLLGKYLLRRLSLR